MNDKKPSGHRQTNIPVIINPNPPRPDAGVPSSTMTPRPTPPQQPTTEPKRENNSQ